MEEMQNLPDFRNQLSRTDLFAAFKKQLAKDFEQSNFPADFVSALEPDYARIHEKIVDQLIRSETKSDFNVMNLLYRIDISEAQLKKHANESSESHWSVIAELIIKRVLQKVVIRQYYKNHHE